MQKIQECTINGTNIQKYIYKFENIILKIECDINDFSELIKDTTIYELFNNYNILYTYLLKLKIYNRTHVLLNILKKNPTNLCSQIKIFNEQFNIKHKRFKYKFEALFELLIGSELYNEQFDRYIQIINERYDDKVLYDNEDTNLINYSQIGGYPLHHFMMGKGKSAIITPILSLYYTLINHKRVYIIVPDHLVEQTMNTIKTFAFIFNIKFMVVKDKNENDEIIKVNESLINDILKKELIICSDSKIKELFLEGLFIDKLENTKSLFLIDEFDSILDPTKSNFNIIKDSSKTLLVIYNMIKPSKKIKKENIKIIEDGIINIDNQLITNDIIVILQQIKNKILVENINWGINPITLAAIPFRSKDNPLLNSNFSSGIVTVFLTLYYFIVIKKYEITDLIVNYIIKNNIINEYFKEKNPLIISIEYIESKLNNDEEKINFFEYIFIKIFNKIKLTSNQYNTSFVDILNIDNIFKIGYSGTLNIDLPEIFSNQETFNDREKVLDEDERVNIEHAISESIINTYIKQ